MKRVLVLGNGGREDALVWAASRSPEVEQVMVMSPNARMAKRPKVCDVGVWPKGNRDRIATALAVAKKGKATLTIVGPEDPLCLDGGIVNAFEAEGLPIFGPRAEAAALEGDKWFAYEVAKAAGVPMGESTLWDNTSGSIEQLVSGLLMLRAFEWAFKARGLAAGKGVILAHNFPQCLSAIARMLVDGEFGQAGNEMLLQQFLAGHPGLPRAELSILVLVDKLGNFLPLMAAQDHKPINDGDQGSNTGGMFAYAPVPWFTPAMLEQIQETIIKKTILEMARRGKPFYGTLYFGLILTADGFKLIEYNCRFGDPELQPILMLLDTDIIPILNAIACGESIKGVELDWKPGAAATLVVAANGYPGSCEKGKQIYGLDRLPKDDGFEVFHAGTVLGSDGQALTNGGRVLNLTQYLPDGLEAVARRLPELAEVLSFGKDEPGAGVHFRTDCGLGVPTSVAA